MQATAASSALDGDQMPRATKAVGPDPAGRAGGSGSHRRAGRRRGPCGRSWKRWRREPSERARDSSPPPSGRRLRRSRAERRCDHRLVGCCRQPGCCGGDARGVGLAGSRRTGAARSVGDERDDDTQWHRRPAGRERPGRGGGRCTRPSTLRQRRRGCSLRRLRRRDRGRGSRLPRDRARLGPGRLPGPRGFGHGAALRAGAEHAAAPAGGAGGPARLHLRPLRRPGSAGRNHRPPHRRPPRPPHQGGDQGGVARRGARSSGGRQPGTLPHGGRSGRR